MNTKLEWVPADWPAPPGVVAGCTVRTGGVSTGNFESLNLGAHVGDSDADVKENRRRFQHICGLPGAPTWLNQVHGNTVVVDPDGNSVPEADAAVSRIAGTVCAVLTADCLPVIFAADDGTEVAVAHAGWRGLGDGILEATLAAISTPPGELLAWLGPAISQPAFEIGAEVREYFLGQRDQAHACFRENEHGRWQADLYGLARQRLVDAGISRIFGGNFCTYQEADRFFSYRRDGQCGRMASFVYRSS